MAFPPAETRGREPGENPGMRSGRQIPRRHASQDGRGNPCRRRPRIPQGRTRAIVDGWVFPEEIANIYAAGRQHAVPVIVGSNADEGTTLAGTAVPTSGDVLAAVEDTSMAIWPIGFSRDYPVTSDSDVRDAFLHNFRDEWFTWEMRTWARMMKHARLEGLSLLLYARAASAGFRRSTAPITRPKSCTSSTIWPRLPWKSRARRLALAEATMSGAGCDLPPRAIPTAATFPLGRPTTPRASRISNLATRSPRHDDF